MTIYDLIRVLADDSQAVRVYEYTDNDCTLVYEGTARDIPYDMQDEEVVNIDNLETDCVLSIAYYAEEE